MSDAATTHGPTVEQHWNDLVTAALLGTDRRDPPPPIDPLADLVDDTARAEPSQRMLAHVAACTAVRRAGVLPGPPVAPLMPPPPDERPPCPVAAVRRWHHITRSWPVLEDEWTLELIGARWRAAPELVPAMLARHRSDPVRRARALAAAGPLGPWLIELLPGLAATFRRRAVSPESVVELPELPIPPDLAELLEAPAADVARTIGVALERSTFGPSHRAVLVNLVARMPAIGLGAFADVLATVDPITPGHAIANALVDLAATRRRMLDELAPAAPSPP